MLLSVQRCVIRSWVRCISAILTLPPAWLTMSLDQRLVLALVLLVVNNGYTSATGWQLLPSIREDRTGLDTLDLDAASAAGLVAIAFNYDADARADLREDLQSLAQAQAVIVAVFETRGAVDKL